eukprot:XP_011663165.1 PREDICTED: basic phospholipase A2 1 isoform X2 [Strongylocentrotus purpuratus]
MDLIMNSFLTLIIINVCLLFGIGQADLVHRRRPRAIWQFSSMIECATGRPAWHFNNYGCWCGLGGGGKPVDEVDACCRSHDECYDYLTEEGTCSLFTLYFTSYLYERRHCEEMEEPSIACGEGSPCRTGLCDCDREAALCLAHAKYNDHRHNYDKDLCIP